jgi:hypothetical protein
MKKPFARKGWRDRSGGYRPRVILPPRPVEGAGAFASMEGEQCLTSGEYWSSRDVRQWSWINVQTATG